MDSFGIWLNWAIGSGRFERVRDNRSTFGPFTRIVVS
jgi:hypothetical protein